MLFLQSSALSLITIHYSLFTYHLSLFTYHLSLFTIHYSLFTYHFSLFTILCPLYRDIDPSVFPFYPAEFVKPENDIADFLFTKTCFGLNFSEIRSMFKAFD